MERPFIDCRIVDVPMDPGALLLSSTDNSCGAIASFIGTVRTGSHRRQGVVQRLEYEAYIPMAEKEMIKIAGECAERYGLSRVIVHHRVGSLEPGQMAVIVIVTAPHRSEAFEACRTIMEELKKRVPIWKREIFSDGAVWGDDAP